MRSMKLGSWRSVSLVLAFIALMLPLFVSIITAQERPVKLVGTSWLEANLAKKDMVIVDIRDSIKDYWAGHISGAVYLSPDALRWPEDGVPVKLIQTDDLADLLGKMGIDSDTNVMVYSETSNTNTSYLIWALDYIGHKNSMILDGGFNKWKSEERNITQDYPEIKSKRYKVQKLNKDVRADLGDVKKTLGKREAILIDARTAELYKGEAGPWKRKGHVKGAMNHFWGKDLKEDGTWKNERELKQIYEGMEVIADKNIIVYCGQGLMSSHLYFTLKHLLGYPNVKNYDGGFSEWSNRDDLPIEKGMGEAVTVIPAATVLDVGTLLEERCTQCHTLKRVDKANKDKAGWEKAIDRMIKKGAKLNAKERAAMIEYLSSR